jgi:hypothetical protein
MPSDKRSISRRGPGRTGALTSVHCYKQTRYRLDWVLPLDEDRSGLSENGASRGADYFLWAMRALAALRRFAMRLRAYLIGSSSIVLGSYSSAHSLAFSMALVGGVCNRFKLFVEARNSAAILGRSVSFAANEAWIGDPRLTSTDIGDREPMLPCSRGQFFAAAARRAGAPSLP